MKNRLIRIKSGDSPTLSEISAITKLDPHITVMNNKTISENLSFLNFIRVSFPCVNINFISEVQWKFCYSMYPINIEFDYKTYALMRTYRNYNSIF